MKWTMGLVGVAALFAASTATAAEFGEYGFMGLRIAVQDMEKSMAFYGKLGMKVGRRYHEDQQEMTWEKPTQGPNIVLVTGSKTLKPGTASFMMYVPDAVATTAALKAAKFEVTREPSGTGEYQIMLAKDPDGNFIEVIAPGKKK